MPDDILTTTLQLEPDESSGKRSAKMVNTIADSMDDLNKAIERSVKASAQQVAANDRVTTSFIRQQLELKGTIDANGKLLKQQASQMGHGEQGFERGLSSLAQVAGGGAAGEALRFGADITGAIANIGGVKEALASLGPVGIAAALGVGAVSLALIEQNKIASETTNGVKQIVERERQFYELRVAGTTKSIEAAVKQAEFEQKIAQARVDDLKFVEQGYKETAEALGVFTGAVIELGGTVGVGGLKNIRDARLAYDEANEALNKANQNLNLYKGLLDDTSTATHDAAEAEAELAKQRQLLVDQLADVQLSTQIKVNSLTSEGANKRLQDIRDEVAARQALIDSGTLSVEKTNEYKTAITKLGQEMVTLNIEILPLIQAREAEAAAIEYQKKQIEETAAAVKKFNEDIANIEQKNLEARQAASERYYDRVSQIAEAAAQAAESALRQLEQRRSDLARDLARAEIDAETERQRDELDAQIEFQREEAKAARDHASELRRIRREANRDESQAIQDRDAVALDAAQTRKQDEIHDAVEGYLQAARERRIAFAQEAADRRVAMARDRQDRLLKYQRDLQDAQAAYQADLALAAQKRQQDLAQAQAQYQRDLILLQQKYQQELAARRTAAVNELRLIQQTEAQRVAIMAQAQAQLMNQARALLASAGASAASGTTYSNIGGSSGARLSIPSFDTGGRITKTGLALVHAGEVISNPKRGQSAGGSVILNLNGMQQKEIAIQSKQHAIDTAVAILQEQL